MKLKNLIIGVIVIAIFIAVKLIFFPGQSGQANGPQAGKGGNRGGGSSNVTAYVAKPLNRV